MAFIFHEDSSFNRTYGDKQLMTKDKRKSMEKVAKPELKSVGPSTVSKVDQGLLFFDHLTDSHLTFQFSLDALSGFLAVFLSLKAIFFVLIILISDRHRQAQQIRNANIMRTLALVLNGDVK